MQLHTEVMAFHHVHVANYITCHNNILCISIMFVMEINENLSLALDPSLIKFHECM